MGQDWDKSGMNHRASFVCSMVKRTTKSQGTGNRIFQDQFKTEKDPKLEKLYKTIELDEGILKNQDEETKIITGDELRSKRERDQKVRESN